ncbi:transforming growth factor beta activator LRRC33-like [Alosa sapidissima]|uniref:transforming growth factor beta activator LRRC33-like n=1 Tax=Alosa sapidissima TaxID=34773 RepID=UPI001C080B45|nr:transforming growth factor beta activator LRRC33-like [Alosa sapidissima]
MIMGRRLVMLMFMALYADSYSHFNKLSEDTHTRLKRNLWSQRNLSSIPLGLDEGLIKLDLSNNLIKNFTTINLPFLERLDVSYNHLSFIHTGAFKNLVQLHDLNLASNSLNNNIISNSQAFKDLHVLRSLDISKNNLDEEAVKQYLSSASSLDCLTATGNVVSKLTTQSFANTKNLRVINLENNLISKIEEGTFNPLKKLAKLNLARNNLAVICDFKLSQVTYLNLSRNSIEFFITHETEEVYNLEVLDLSYNSLLYFPILPKHNHLKYLHLQNNRLGALGIVNSVAEANHLYKDVTGSNHSRTENEKDSVYSDWQIMPLVHLDLSSNHFRSFPLTMFRDLQSLETLNIGNNCLQNISNSNALSEDSRTDIHNYSLPSLLHINLKDNNIEYLSSNLSTTFPKIETMVLKGNRVRPCSGQSFSISDLTTDVQCISFSNISTLKHLDLQENGIKTLLHGVFANSPLVSLNLAGNKQLTIAKNALKDVQNTLQFLSIGQNNVTDSQFGLACMRELRILNVSDNNLKNLPSTTACSPLLELDVRNNSLTTLKNVTMSHLSIIYISGNTFNCCQATWIQSLKQENVTIPDLDRTECFHQTEIITLSALENSNIMCFDKVTRGYALLYIIILCCVFIFVLIATFGYTLSRTSCHFVDQYSIFSASSISLTNLVRD